MHISLLDALFPKTRQAVLSALLLHPEKWWYLSDLARHIGVPPSSLQRELSSLTAAGLLSRRKDGNRVYYQANPASPCLPDLQALFVKTAGVADIVKSALRRSSDKFDLAFIYGSFARGAELASSDIDVLIIGDLKLAQVAPALRKAEQALEREINVTVFSKKEFINKSRNENSFLRTVLGDKKIFLKGTDAEIAKMVGPKRDSKG